MELRRIRRLSWVLVASELRSGRTGADPRAFTGQPSFLLLLDLILGGGVGVLATLFLRQTSSVAPSLGPEAVHQLLPALPLFCLGGVVIAGVLFELNRSARFSGSDAANWMPLSPREYVAASAAAVAYSDSLIAALAIGFALGVGDATGQWGPTLLAMLLSVNALLAGAFIVEMIRSSTQRATAALTGRAGRVVLVGRAGLFIVVIFVFEIAFNPILLLRVLDGVAALGLWAAGIPFLWGSLAVQQATGGAVVGTVGYLALAVGLTAGLGEAAATLRVRFWAPIPAELRLERHEYGEAHAVLAAVGLSRIEAVLVAKDLRGLVRRREMLPILAIPIVLVGVFAFSSSTGSGGASDAFLPVYSVYVAGFASLLLASASYAQERRSIQVLYQIPVDPRTIYRAKVAVPLLFGLAYAGVITALTFVVAHPPVAVVVATGLASVGGGVLSTLLGLWVASRYSDFQERPRPQFVRPWAMIATFLVALPMNLGIATVAVVAAQAYDSSGHLPLDLALGDVVAVVLLAGVLAWLARRGAMEFLRQLPY